MLGLTNYTEYIKMVINEQRERTSHEDAASVRCYKEGNNNSLGHWGRETMPPR